MIHSTCKGCENRYPACHDSCEAYQEYRERVRNQKQQIWNEKKKSYAFRKHKDEQIMKAQRRRGKK